MGAQERWQNGTELALAPRKARTPQLCRVTVALLQRSPTPRTSAATCLKSVAVLLRRLASEFRPDAAEALALSRPDPPIDRTSEPSRPGRPRRARARILRRAGSVR